MCQAGHCRARVLERVMNMKHGMWFIGEAAVIEQRNKAICDELMAHLEACCNAANRLFKQGDTMAGRAWSDRAQNIRRVLVDYEVLPATAL